MMQFFNHELFVNLLEFYKLMDFPVNLQLYFATSLSILN